MSQSALDRGLVLDRPLRGLASELAEKYQAGQLAIVAGAGLSRAAGLPGWSELIERLQEMSIGKVGLPLESDRLEAVFSSLHRSDPIARADSLRRLLGVDEFSQSLHSALFQEAAGGGTFKPSIGHWHLASMIDPTRLPEVHTSNYDDLIEIAKNRLGRRGRVRHFHGTLRQRWTGRSPLTDPPVITTRDFLSAEDKKRYELLVGDFESKTVLLVGMSLDDPNLTRIIKKVAADCRAIVVASPGSLSPEEQEIRVNLMDRYWKALGVRVTAIEAHEELPAFLLELRRQVSLQRGRSLSAVGAQAFRETTKAPFESWPDARLWRNALRSAVTAAKAVSASVAKDSTLAAGYYSIEPNGWLGHRISSNAAKATWNAWPARRLLVDDIRPWGAAGYAFAAGVPIASTSLGMTFDRNVPRGDLLTWQEERTAQRRLPPASVLCDPAWVKWKGAILPTGVMYFSSHSPTAFDQDSANVLRLILRLTFADMIDPLAAITEIS